MAPETDPLGRMLQYGIRRVREMPVGREWVLAVRTMGEAFVELFKLGLLAVRFCSFVMRSLAGIAR